ncbi:MAG: DUF3623 family protein [Rhodopseudomonas palustris]|nr:DUF3623 family protein [Rhodopseudomonas palustris]
MSAYILVHPIYRGVRMVVQHWAVLLLIGSVSRDRSLRLVFAGGLLTIALCGLSVTAGDTQRRRRPTWPSPASSVCGAAQEIAFLSGWLTGPRRSRAPPGAQRLYRALPMRCRPSSITSSSLLVVRRAGDRADLERRPTRSGCGLMPAL